MKRSEWPFFKMSFSHFTSSFLTSEFLFFALSSISAKLLIPPSASSPSTKNARPVFSRCVTGDGLSHPRRLSLFRYFDISVATSPKGRHGALIKQRRMLKFGDRIPRFPLFSSSGTAVHSALPYSQPRYFCNVFNLAST